ncbi:MAG: molybdenum cofactor biosynthesis protein MoaE [Alphaproteobacteria bacterium]|nr:MAG: molybdenum cofactor biosynthesis protein MoaE [Alphaproteobacteria bacterium]
MTAIRVCATPIDLASEIADFFARNEGAGAIVHFIGRMRGTDGDARIVAMELEHYPGMCEAELARIAEEVRARFSLDDARIVHRIGRMTAGDPIVLVATAARHRREAFAGAEALMDFLKTRAPFWKKEHFADGTSRWVEARESDERAAQRWVLPAESTGVKGRVDEEAP